MSNKILNTGLATAVGSQGEWIQIAGGGWVNAHYVTAN